MFLVGMSPPPGAAADFRASCAWPPQRPCLPRAPVRPWHVPKDQQPVGRKRNDCQKHQPITVLKRSRSIRSMAKFSSSTKTMAPRKALPDGAGRRDGDHRDVDHAVDADATRMRPLNQAISTPPSAAMSAAVGGDAAGAHVEADRFHAPVVADRLQRHAEVEQNEHGRKQARPPPGRGNRRSAARAIRRGGRRDAGELVKPVKIA